MIHDFALEPELVATWHDRRVAYPVLCQMGIGHRRVGCLFPALAWKSRVMNAMQAAWAGGDAAAAQLARKNVEVLLQHLEQVTTRRGGSLADGEDWLAAALREHGDFPFGGILVREATTQHDSVVAADRLATSEFRAWSPPARPVERQSRNLAEALAPLLRCAAELRFVDQYFDADDETFREPMEVYLRVAQHRRVVSGLQLELHFAVRPRDVEEWSSRENRQLNESGVADLKVRACEARLGPLLLPGVRMRVVAWGKARSGVEMHNRYVLSNVGSILVGTGLDRSRRAPTQTDDLTILSAEQHRQRWTEFSSTGTLYRKLNERVVIKPSAAQPDG